MAGIAWGGVAKGRWEGGKAWRVEFARLDAVGGGLASCQPEYQGLLDDCLREARRSGERIALTELFLSGKSPTHVIRLTVRWPDQDEQVIFACRCRLEGVFYGWGGESLPHDQVLIEMGRWFRSLLSHSKCGARANSQQVTPCDFAWKYWCQCIVVLWLMLKAPPSSDDD